jgi:GNAT superfamily N-acetyltransferase
VTAPRDPRAYFLRPLSLADVRSLHVLQQRCFPPTLWDPPEMLADVIRGAVVALAAVDAYNGLLGAAVVRPTPGGPAELYSIEVAPDARRRGIGAALVRAVLDSTTGPLAAFCTPGGRALCLAVGFRETGRTIGRDGHQLVELLAQREAIRERKAIAAALDEDAALDAIYESTDDALCEGRFADVDAALAALDVETVPILFLLGWLSITLAAAELLPSREAFAAKVRARVERDDPEHAEGLLRGLA